MSVDELVLSDRRCVSSGKASEVPPFVIALRKFQLGCWNRGSMFAALSSRKTEMAQSRSHGYGDPPSAAVRFARPVVDEFTSLNQNALSCPAGRWSAA